MLFSSATFLFAFLPVVALLYYLIPKRCTAARNLFLTGASLLFYAWGGTTLCVGHAAGHRVKLALCP